MKKIFRSIHPKKRTLKDVLLAGGLPETFRAPKTNAGRYESQRLALREIGWFAIRPQDKRITDDERRVLAQIELRLSGASL